MRAAGTGVRSVGAAISAFLCVAGYQFVQAEHQAGKILVYGAPLWAIELISPIGFGAIALRLLWRAAESWPLRGLTAALAAGLVWSAVKLPVASNHLIVPALSLLAAATLLGAPAFITLGGVALGCSSAASC